MNASTRLPAPSAMPLTSLMTALRSPSCRRTGNSLRIHIEVTDHRLTVDEHVDEAQTGHSASKSCPVQPNLVGGSGGEVGQNVEERIGVAVVHVALGLVQAWGAGLVTWLVSMVLAVEAVNMVPALPKWASALKGDTAARRSRSGRTGRRR